MDKRDKRNILRETADRMNKLKDIVTGGYYPQYKDDLDGEGFRGRVADYCRECNRELTLLMLMESRLKERNLPQKEITTCCDSAYKHAMSALYDLMQYAKLPPEKLKEIYITIGINPDILDKWAESCDIAYIEAEAAAQSDNSTHTVKSWMYHRRNELLTLKTAILEITSPYQIPHFDRKVGKIVVGTLRYLKERGYEWQDETSVNQLLETRGITL